MKSSTVAGVPYRASGVNIKVERCQNRRRNTKEDHMARTRSTTAAKTAAKPKDKTEAEMMAAAGIVPAEEPKTDHASPATEQPKAKKVREVGPATQKVIDHIRELYVNQGLGFPSIAKKLNEEGVKTFRGGDTWHPPVVRGICLRNGWTKGEKQTTKKED